MQHIYFIFFACVFVHFILSFAFGSCRKKLALRIMLRRRRETERQSETDEERTEEKEPV